MGKALKFLYNTLLIFILLLHIEMLVQYVNDYSY